MCFNNLWEASKEQLTWACLTLNLISTYLILGVLFQCIYVLVNLEDTYEFTGLFQLVTGFETVFCISMIIDTFFIAFRAKRLYSNCIVIILLLTGALLVLGGLTVLLYTDAYVVVRGYHSKVLYYYEKIYSCCGINGPQDYYDVDSFQNDSIPLSCYKDRVPDPVNLYTQGCLFASTDHWFWFVFSNCYWFVFVLVLVDAYLHLKLTYLSRPITIN